MIIRAVFYASVLALTFTPHRAEAAQRYSESLLDCATPMDTSNRIDPEKADYGKGLILSRIAEALEKAAYSEALSEGHADPDAYLSRLKSDKINHWDGKGHSFVFSDEFEDWMAYCRTFSAHLGSDFQDFR